MEDNQTPDTVQNPIELTAGEMLRNARTTGRRKREIPTIAKQLCIREEFLQALEEGNYTLIPELVYILGFARNYAMELGLNPDEIVTKIKREMGVIPDCASADGDAEACGIISKGGKGDHNKTDVKSMFLRMWSFVIRRWYWFVEALAVLLLIAGLVVFAFSGNDEVADAPAEEVVATEQVETGPAFRMAVRERLGTEKSEDSVIILQATRDSWLKVDNARGRAEFARTLLKGDVYYVPATGKYKATFGDAGGIDVWVNGTLAPKVGADHERKLDVVLDAEKLMAGPKAEKDKKAEKTDKSDKTEAKVEEKKPEPDKKTE